MRILLCSDGTSEAASAERFGALLAIACRAHVTLLGVAENTGERQRVAENLERDRLALKADGVDCEVVLREGEPTREIMTFSDGEDAFDLVVLGARRKAGAGRYWRSARVYKLIRTLTSPVLIVMGRREKLARVLVCSGGRGYITPALDVAGVLASGARADVTLLHIIAEPPGMYAQLSAMRETTEQVMASGTDLAKHLQTEEARLKSAGVNVQVRVRQGPILHELAEEIRTGDYDMVVTGTAVAQSPLRRYIMGDVTREIVNRVGCPVLVVQSRVDGAVAKSAPKRRLWRSLFGRD